MVTRSQRAHLLVIILSIILLFPIFSYSVSQHVEAQTTNFQIDVVPPYPLENVKSTLQISITNIGSQTALNAEVTIDLPSDWTNYDGSVKSVGSLSAGGKKVISWSVKAGSIKLSTTTISITSDNLATYFLETIIPVFRKIEAEAIKYAGETVQRVIGLEADYDHFDVYKIGSIIFPLSDTCRQHASNFQSLLLSFYTREYIIKTPNFVAAFTEILHENNELYSYAQSIYSGARATASFSILGIGFTESMCEFLLWRYTIPIINWEVSTANLLSTALGVEPVQIEAFASFILYILTQIQPIFNYIVSYQDVAQFLQDIINSDSPKVQTLLYFLNNMASSIASSFSTALSLLSNFISNYIMPIRDWIEIFKEKLIEVFNEVITAIQDTIPLILQAVEDTLVSVFTLLRNRLNDLLTWIVSSINACNNLVSSLSAQVDRLIAMAESISTETTVSLQSLVTRLFDKSSSSISDARAVLTTSRNVIYWMKGLGYDVPSYVEDGLTASSRLITVAESLHGSSSTAKASVTSSSITTPSSDMDCVESLRASQASLDFSMDSVRKAEQTTHAIRGQIEDVDQGISRLGDASSQEAQNYLQQAQSERDQALDAYNNEEYWSSIQKIELAQDYVDKALAAETEYQGSQTMVYIGVGMAIVTIAIAATIARRRKRRKRN